MTDAAHVGSHNNPVFAKPFRVEPAIETWKTPENYHEGPDGKDLPDRLPETMDVWKVQDTGEKVGGVVFGYSPYKPLPGNCEILVVGYNWNKPYGAASVARHGNFLQWGYYAPPSQMTEAGQKLFLNCIHYISSLRSETKDESSASKVQ